MTRVAEDFGMAPDGSGRHHGRCISIFIISLKQNSLLLHFFMNLYLSKISKFIRQSKNFHVQK